MHVGEWSHQNLLGGAREQFWEHLKQKVSQIMSVLSQYRSIPMFEAAIFLRIKRLAILVDYLLLYYGKLVHGSTADFWPTHVQLLSDWIMITKPHTLCECRETQRKKPASLLLES